MENSSKAYMIVPEYRGQTLPIGVLLAILKSAEIPESDWKA